MDIRNAIRTDAGYDIMGHGPTNVDLDYADVSEVYDVTFEAETTEQIVVEEDSDAFGKNLEDDSTPID